MRLVHEAKQGNVFRENHHNQRERQHLPASPQAEGVRQQQRRAGKAADAQNAIEPRRAQIGKQLPEKVQRKASRFYPHTRDVHVVIQIVVIRDLVCEHEAVCKQARQHSGDQAQPQQPAPVQFGAEPRFRRPQISPHGFSSLFRRPWLPEAPHAAPLRSGNGAGAWLPCKSFRHIRPRSPARSSACRRSATC